MTAARFTALVPALAAAALAAAPAAACPTELGAGVAVEYDDDTRSEYRPGPGGTLVETMIYSDGSGFSETTYHGFYLLSSFDFNENGDTISGTVRTTVPNVDLSTLPVPADGVVVAWHSEQIYDDGREDTEGRLLNVSTPRQATYGGCTYDVLTALLRVEPDGEEDYLLIFDFVPALGLGLYRAFTPVMMLPEPDAIVRPLSITALDP